MKIIFLISFFLLSLNGISRDKKIKQGLWHTTFQLNETSILPVTFLFEKHNRHIHLSVINAEEYIHLRDVVLKGDSILISFPAFASVLKAKIINKSTIKGHWHNYAKKNYSIPFQSINKKTSRFPKMGSQIDVNGKWEVTFNYDSNPEKAIGIFSLLHPECSQCTEDIKGTFLTETGDYRYLEGVVSNDSLYLSTFDGSHAFLFRSKFVKDTLWGEFLSGKHYKTNWYAVRNENYKISDPDSLTYLVSDESIQLSLPGLDKKTYNYPNDLTKNKVTLIQIMGTWCPNCLDESSYLKTQKAMYKDDLEIIAVAFETQATLDEKIEKVKSYKENLGLDYTFLIGGKASKPSAAKLFPMLNHIISFPTLIFIDKKGEIRRVHTGFNGPGTGMYYENFKTETNQLIKELIAE